MTERHIPETYVGKDYVVIIINNEAYKIAKEYDEDEINLEIEYMNKARESGIPVPKVIEVTDRGMIMEMAKGYRALDIWDKFDIDKKKTFILSLTNLIKKFPKKGKFYLAHKDLDLQNIFVDDDGGITDIIDWRDCEYLPEVYIRRLPAFLGADVYDSDVKILKDIYHKEMGKLSEIEDLVIDLHSAYDYVDLSIVESVSDCLNTEMAKVTTL